MTVYKWKPGAHVAIDAQLAGEEMERIKQAHNGRLDAEDVVSEAVSDDSPLHDHFNWDDASAAHERRLQQAMYLIRSIVFVPEPTKEDSKPIRAFASIKQEDDQFYVSTTTALADPELRAQVLAQAWKELEAWRRRHAELVEFARVFSVIDKAWGARK